MKRKRIVMQDVDVRKGMECILKTSVFSHLYTRHFLSITTSFDERLHLEVWADVPYRAQTAPMLYYGWHHVSSFGLDSELDNTNGLMVHGCSYL